MSNLTQMTVEQMKQMKMELTRFMMAYRFALDEMNTKINILKDEFTYIHEYNPIEHSCSRVKSPESLFNKVMRKDIPFTLESIRENILDIAGIRITCSFRSDIYRIKDMLLNQKDIETVEVKDYIENPKPNGYQSLHLIVKVPVFMSDREEKVPVEIQIRTIAMDFWASLEHKIYYKYDKAVPNNLVNELKEAADVATALDYKMERLHNEVSIFKEKQSEEELTTLNIQDGQFTLPMKFLESFAFEQDKEEE